MVEPRHKRNSSNAYKKLFNIIRLLILTLIITEFFVYVPETTEASLVIARIEFDTSFKTASVRPGYVIPVVFYGNVTVDRRGATSKAQYIEVILSVEALGDGWAAQASPPYLIFSHGVKKEPFVLTVVAPYAERHETKREINITGRWQAAPSAGEHPLSFGEIYGTSVSVYIDQYFRFNVYEEPPLRIVWPGDTVEYDLVIQNVGNGLDTFDIIVTNEDSLLKAGYVVEVDRTSIDIKSRNESRIKITVHGAEPLLAFWRIANTEINIRVESQGGKRNHVPYQIVKEGSFYYYENGPYVSEPVWISLIIIIIIIVILIIRIRRKTKQWREKRKKRLEKKEEKA
jgi:hypothetical protein